MDSVDNVARPSSKSARLSVENGSSAAAWLTSFCVLAAVIFNLGLCFLSTRGLAITPALLGIVQLLIMLVALALAHEMALTLDLRLAVLALGWFLFLRLSNPTVDPKIIIDLAIPFIFLALGRLCARPEVGDRLVLSLLVGIFGLGLFEYFQQSRFTEYFDILRYYANKGGAEEAQSVNGTKLFASGIRPEGEGRSLLAFLLSDHRVSSVFLEPVSAGNFGVICAAWGFCRLTARDRTSSLVIGLIIALAIAVIVFADARFGAVTMLIIALALLLPESLRRPIAMVMPFALIAFLIILATVEAGTPVDNSFIGRLTGSGHLLDSFTGARWLGLDPRPIFTFDSGYGYVITNFGLPAAVVWLAFTFGLCDRPRTPAPVGGRRMVQASSIRPMPAYGFALAIYLALGLCISGSTLSIKTAALAWFLLGLITAPTMLPWQGSERRP